MPPVISLDSVTVHLLQFVVGIGFSWVGCWDSQGCIESIRVLGVSILHGVILPCVCNKSPENKTHVYWDDNASHKVLVQNDGIRHKTESRYVSDPWTISSVHTNE